MIRKRLFCDQCLPARRREVLSVATPAFNAATIAKLAALRAAGQNPRRLPRSSAPPHRIASQQRKAVAAWRDDGSLDGVDFKRDIHPEIQGLPVRVIAEAIGASISRGSKVRSGRLVPHMPATKAQPRGKANHTPDERLLAKFARGLGDPTRLRILRLLLSRPRNVSDIIAHLSMPQSRVSNHLACLKWCGYVVAEREGRTITYRVIDARLKAVIELIGGIVTDNAAHIASCARIDP
ncbi:MAG: metalloregulator ArsR/SmtB family transcription factor [Candidatus Cybelea sp.]